MGAEQAQRAPEAQPGGLRAASEARQRWIHALACLGAALRSLPWTRSSSTLSTVPRLTRGPTGPSRLQSKPKAECPACHRVYAQVWVSQGLQTGETASRLPAAAVLRLRQGVKWGPQPDCFDGAGEGEQWSAGGGPQSLCGAGPTPPACPPRWLPCGPAGTQAAERSSGLPGRRWARCPSVSSWGTGGLVHSFIHSLSQQTLVGAHLEQRALHTQPPSF